MVTTESITVILASPNNSSMDSVIGKSKLQWSGQKLIALAYEQNLCIFFSSEVNKGFSCANRITKAYCAGLFEQKGHHRYLSELYLRALEPVIDMQNCTDDSEHVLAHVSPFFSAYSTNYCSLITSTTQYNSFMDGHSSEHLREWLCFCLRVFYLMEYF